MEKEKVLYHAVVCFPDHADRILMAIKTEKIGQGCWNGYGGGIEPGESVEQAALRELAEESAGVRSDVNDLVKMAIVDFHNTKSDGETFVCRVHFFLVKNWIGQFEATEEMTDPTWFAKDDLPLAQMMPADRDWLSLALQGKKIMARAYLGPFQKEKLKPTEVWEVEEFPDTATGLIF